MSFELQRARCLDLLRHRGQRGATTDELSHPTVGGHEGTRRVRELRAEGYPVQREPMRNGYWRYWLGPPSPNAQIDLFWDEDEPASGTREASPTT